MTNPPNILFLLLFGGMALVAFPLRAAPYFTGTGFVVSRQGQVVTNAHVVDHCVNTRVRAVSGTFFPAKILARDEEKDLALLATPLMPERIARLRHPYTGVEVSEKVMVMGFPQESARDGKYRVAYSHVRGLQGLQGESDWLQFEDSVKMGNSGGPLLDYAANVVGVITGKATLTRHNALAARDEVLEKSDFAINLETLRGFLGEHRVAYESRDSLLKLSPQQIESAGREFVVNVLCRQGR